MELVLIFLDWLTYGFAPWFIAAMCLFWLPRITLSLGSIFLIYWLYWASTLDDNISELMKTEFTMSIAEIHSDQNVAIGNRENCGWFNESCQVYKAINKLLDEDTVTMEDGTNIATHSSQVVVLNTYSDSEPEQIKQEVQSYFDQLSDSELEEEKQSLTQLIKTLQAMEAQGKTDVEIEAYLLEFGITMLELQALREIFGL